MGLRKKGQRHPLRGRVQCCSRHSVIPKNKFVGKPAPIDDRVTCAACRFTYARTREFCPMCGGTARAEDPIGTREEPASRTNLSVTALVGAIVVTLTCAVYLWTTRTQTAAQIPPVNATRSSVESALSSTGTLSLPVTPAVGTSSVAVRKPAQPDGTHDAIELWKRVRRGNADAEVELAMMYLDGREVSQNCEQAHLLLLAAAKKQPSKSSILLSRMYAQRCP